jgi:hypothetical protein
MAVLDCSNLGRKRALAAVNAVSGAGYTAVSEARHRLLCEPHGLSPHYA